MERNDTGNKDRLPYEKPTLRVIELAAEEILGSCKLTVASTGPFPPVPVCVNCGGTFGGS